MLTLSDSHKFEVLCGLATVMLFALPFTSNGVLEKQRVSMSFPRRVLIMRR